MISRFRFRPRSLRSLGRLRERVVYGTDLDAPSHASKGITIEGGRNRFCADDSGDSFICRALARRSAYQAYRRGRHGKASHRLFAECCYSPPVYAELSEEERLIIEEVLHQRMFPYTATRSVWHRNPLSKRDDLHILSATYTEDTPPRVHLSDGYGNGGQNFILGFERAEEEALARINARRPVSQRILTARQIKAKRLKLAGGKRLAHRLRGLWDGKRATLQKVLEKLGYREIRVTAKMVFLISPRATGRKSQSAQAMNIETLAQEMRSSSGAGDVGARGGSGFEMA